MRNWYALPAVALAAVTLVIGTATCGGGRDIAGGDLHCRNNPGDCAGEIGGSCANNADCGEGVCCTEGGNCAGGMCLFPCSEDRDCPNNTLCEHNFCFFACNNDADCGPGQSCEHGSTICEYE